MFSIHLPGRRFAYRFAVAVAIALVFAAGGSASADSHRSSHELRDRAAGARAEEQTLAGDIAAQSEQIDQVESAIGDLSDEVAQLEAQLDREKSLLRAVEKELREKKRTL